MELHADVPWVIFDLDNLGQAAVRGHAREDQTAFFELVPVFRVHLIAVAVAFLDLGRAIDLGHFRAFGQGRGIGAQTHGAAFVIGGFAAHGMVALHPFFEVVNHRLKALFAGFMIEFFRARVLDPRQVARRFDHRHLHAKADAEIGDFALTGELCRFDFALCPAFAKTARDEDRVEAFEVGRGVILIKGFGIHPFHIDLHPVGHAAMGERLCDGFIGVFKLHIFANDGDIDLALGVEYAVGHVVPHGQIRFGRGRDAKSVEHRLIEPLAVIGQRCLIDGFEVRRRDHVFFAHVTEQGDFLAFFFGDRMLGAADQHIWLQADGAQFFDRVLCRLCFELTRGGDIGQEGEVHENTFAARTVLRKLADRFKEGQAFDIAHGTANLAEHEINFVIANFDEIFDLIGDMRDHLNGLAQIVAAALFLEHIGIDAARGDGIGVARGNARKPFVMSKIEIGFRAIVGDENLTMFKRAHRARIDVEIGVQLAQTYRIPTRLQKGAKSGGGKAFAKRRYYTAGDEYVACHGLEGLP